MKKRVADIIIETLLENGIKDTFCVVGGGAMHLDNALAIHKEMNVLFNHHEQACAMAAEAYARIRGTMACVCVTSGPGGLNTLNGVEGAWVDNIPLIVIAGHPRYTTTVEPTNLNLRYRGVQEFDIVSAVKGMTKYVKLIKDPLSVKYEVQKAIDIAMQGRRGPVWLSIPLDVQGSLVEESELLPPVPIQEEPYNVNPSVMEKIYTMLSDAKRPCILTGSGIRAGNAVKEFREFVKLLQIPVVGGALNADLFPLDAPFYFGESGSRGPRSGNFILQNADVILVLANSLSTLQTGFNQKEFAPNAKIIMVDAEKDEAKKPDLHVDFAVYSEIKVFLSEALKTYKKIKVDEKWISYCKQIKDKYCHIEYDEPCDKDGKIAAARFWEIARTLLPENLVLAMGNSTSVAGGILSNGVLKDNQRIITNCNCGSMGYDLPAAIGAAVASKNTVICATGDGSIMMNLQELQTIKHYNLPVKIIIFSNDGYDALRNTWKNFFNGNFVGCDATSGVSFPSFEKVAECFGFSYNCCKKETDAEESIKWLLSQEKYAILEVKEKYNDPIYPKLQSKMNEDGTFETPALHDMYPFLTKEEMKNAMNIE